MSENMGLQALKERVLDRDLCVSCGACTALCPYLRSWQGRVIQLHDCDLTEGRCFAYCPRSKVDLDALYNRLFGRDFDESGIGPVVRVSGAQAVDPRIRRPAQSGGVVSALIDWAIQEGFIDAAVLTQRDAQHLPFGRAARCREDILACAGSGFVAGPTLEPLQSGSWGYERIGVVGLPCQILATAKMRSSSRGEAGTPAGRIGLAIGLFCTWALSYGPFIAFVRGRMNDQEIQRMEITPPPDRVLRVIGERDTQEIGVDAVRRFIRPGCHVCLDMTSELADLSVGAVEGNPGWNTLVVRTACGDELVRRAEAAGIIVTRTLADATMDHLRAAARLKKRRALQTLASRGELQDGYLILSEETRRRILEQQGGSA